MTIETEAKITLTVEDHASAIVRSLRRDFDALNKSVVATFGRIKSPGPSAAAKPSTVSRATDALTIKSEAAAMSSLRKRWTFESRMAKQREAQANAQEQQHRTFEVGVVRDLRQRMTLADRMTRQRAAEAQANERQRRTYDSAAMADIRRRMAFAGRMARQQLVEARAVDRERQRATDTADRNAASSLRRQIAGDRWRFALRNRMDRQERTERERARRETIGRGRDTYHYGQDAVRDAMRPVGVAALAGSATAAAAARKILTTESSIDSAEIDARIYGGFSQDAARKLRDSWAAPLAEALGTGTDRLLAAYTDAVKLGIPSAGASAFSELAVKTSEAWAVPFEAVKDTLGQINTVLTSSGAAFDVEKLKSVANTVQFLAAKQSTTPEKLLEFMRQGAGAAQLLSMSQEAALAFGSASTSLGNRPGESGRMMDYVAGRVIELPRLTKKNGDEGKQARDLVRDLGYGSAERMERDRRANPDEFLPDLLSRFNKIKNPKKQDQAIRFFTGREWLGEFGRMVKGIDTYKEAVKLSKEAKGLDAISAVWDLHRTKLAFVFKQFRSGFLNILGEFGKVLSPMARVAGDYFLAWSSKLRAGGIATRFKAALEGLVAGLGFKDFGGLLQGIFGKPGEGNAGTVETWRGTFQQFGAGIADIVGGIKGLVNSFTDGSPETLVRWTGRILTLSAALLVLSPVLTVIGGIATSLLAIGSTAATVLAAFQVAGLAGGTGAAGLLGAGALTAAGGIIGAAFLATIADKLGVLKAPDVSKGWGRGIVDFLDPGLASRLFGDKEKAKGTPWSDLPAKVEKQSHNGAFDRRGLIHKASVVTEDLVQGLDRLGRTLGNRMGAKIQPAALSAPSMSGFTGSGSGVGAGTAPSGVPGFPAAGVPAGGGPRVPGWYGKGGAAGAGGNPGNLAAPQGPVGERMKSVYQAFRSTGLSHDSAKSFTAEIGRENDFDPTLVFGSHVDPHNRKRNAGMMSWQGDRAEKLLARLWEGGHLNVDGTIQRTQEALNAQARFAVDEMKSGALGPRGQRALGVLNDPNSTHAQRALTLGDDVIKWRQHDPQYAGHATKRDRYYGQLGGLTEGVPGGDGQAVAGSVHPLDGKGRLSSDFGFRRHPISGQQKMHNGVDLAAPAGTMVKAMRDGIASLDRSGDVTVKSADGSSQTYRHVTAQIEAGAHVAAGQMIGRLRAHDPRSTGPHLHLESRGADGRFLDPKALLSAKVPAASPDQAADIVRPGQGFSARRAPSAEDLTSKVPAPIPRGRGAGGGVPGLDAGGTGFQKQDAGGRSGPQVVVHNTIHAGNQSPQEMASHMQRHITEAWNFRSHDLEPELT
ncbi:peptidoglycan DD-metalloendopeptidase family protein [Methylobacterium sp. 37f]|uniref:peptidoglycan DD-metalloendopeptidase family protein n=1 Tax=Methylobacterium sp. 37f TaxID=2817058 RepID=UPI001FFD9737|nr:peptidoglycan DD-metalloendopeptidase family protein [Methylobacterium sp. 37f]MCK2056983.1 peptidoglycan DD-metalloendopeptidase family protein [Methylobacterium sp. 37f]